MLSSTARGIPDLILHTLLEAALSSLDAYCRTAMSTATPALPSRLELQK